MTTWVENPTGGRDRGPRGLARAWVEVLVRPRRFFRNGVASGDQAPGLVFAVCVALVYVASRFLFVPATRPQFFASEAASVVVGLLVAGLIVAPVGLHLVAALEVVLLIPTVPDRAGVSETVQVIAYATAPMALAGVGVPPALAGVAGLDTVLAAWRLLLAGYGVVLFVVGIATVHDTSLPRAAVAAAIPALVVFGYFYGGVYALETATGLEFVRGSGLADAGSTDMETQLPGRR